MSEAAGSLLQLSVGRLAQLLEEDRVPPIDGRLPDCISNALCECLRERGTLDPRTLAALGHTRFTLTHVNLSSCEVSLESLASLFLHPLHSLSLYRAWHGPHRGDPRSLLQFSLLEGSSSRGSLRSLNLGGMPQLNASFSRMLASTLRRLPQLESLLLPDSASLANVDLACVVEVLPHLLHLDISTCPLVSDIGCLASLSQLRVLLLHGVRLDMDARDIATLFRSLVHLEVVDLSDKRSDYHSDSTDERPRVDLAAVLWDMLRESGDRPCWPELKSLDLAGNPMLGLPTLSPCAVVTRLVEAHPRLENLSVMNTPMDRVDLSFPSHPQLRLANEARRENCLHALSLYWRPERDAFTAHALQAVYYLLQSNYDGFSVEEQNESARLIELSMRSHPRNLSIQMAASACLYHLCKLKRIRRLDPRHVRRCIDRCLDAATQFPTTTQLQKNVWLTICNDHLLHSIPIHFYRTCSVALESMLLNRDSSVARMTIAIVSIVAPKVSASESSLLADSRYAAFLVESIKQNLTDMATSRGDNTSHFALKFTLSALWNLTDECAQTCVQIVQHGGVEVAFRVLAQCIDNHNLRTKVLGLLNNIAEVPSLQSRLLTPHYVDFLIALLESSPCRALPSEDGDPVADEGGAPRIDVQYFAAGILSNLVTASESEWEDVGCSREEVNRRMVRVVSNWPRLPYAMVAYRSFSPFVGLLSRSDCPGAQLWAVWAVEHVCIGSQADAEYLRRLRVEGGLSLLHEIVAPASPSSPLVKAIAQRILSHV